MSEGRSWFVRGGIVVDPADGEARPRDLVVRDGTIDAVVEPGAFPAANVAGLPVYDASDRIVVPGLINAHTHGHTALMKGVADRWPLEVSLTYGPALAGHRDAETIYLSTLLGALEMIAKGVTSCYDLVYEFPHPTAAGITAVATAYADAGMRAIVAPMVADRSLFEAYPALLETLPAPLAQTARDLRLAPLAATMTALAEIVALPLPSGIRLGIAPTIPLHCSDAFLAACRDLAESAGLPIHIHVAESRLQATAGVRRYGASLVSHLADCGLVTSRLTAAHGVWLDDDDIACISDAGACIAHVPASNFRLGSGLAPVRAMLDRGVDVALATDGCHCSDSLDVFLAMRLASFASRCYAGPRESWLSSLDVFRAATLGGAAAMGLRGRVGRPSAGFEADLAFLDRTHRAFVPLNDTLNQIVNSDAASAVRDVMIAGRFVVRDGRAPGWTAPLRQRIDRVHHRLRTQTAAARDLAGAFEPFVARYASESARDHYPLERLAPSPSRRLESQVV